jgi:hypothetical protein
MMVLLEEEEEGEESAAARRSAKRVWCATERRTHVVGGHGTSTEGRGQAVKGIWRLCVLGGDAA